MFIFNIIQDRVPAFSQEKARHFIKNELGAPIEQFFKTFEDRPIAAASLGQVFDSCYIPLFLIEHRTLKLVCPFNFT